MYVYNLSSTYYNVQCILIFLQGNVLVDEEHNPWISDFRLACTVGKLQPGLSYLQRLSLNTNNPGAVGWAVPKQLSGCKAHLSGDIYSFGCLMFEMITCPGILDNN